MGLWRGAAIAILLLVSAVLVSSQNEGEQCFRQDNTQGVCRDIKLCVDQDGRVESSTSLRVCSGSTLNRIIACCRRTAAYIAGQKCQEWRRLANAGDSFCRIDTALSHGGSQANIGEFPHMVSILAAASSKLVHICGGMLISRQFVLTAAHCINDTEVYVRIGGHDLTTHEPETTVDSRVINKIIHPEYQQPRRYNDIALLRLAIRVSFSSRVSPACLPYKKNRILPGTKLVIAGWGIYENSAVTSTILRKAKVFAIERLRCDRNPVIAAFVTSVRYPAGITDSIICADESQAGACSGDSGGPLMINTDNPCYVKDVVGIVSRGVVECKKSDVPGTYTRIEYYLDWIVSNVWPDELNLA